MLFAFARDGGLPASRLIARVSPRFHSPHVAVWTSATAAFVVGLWADAYTVMTALSVLALYASYGIPIAASLFASPRRGPWTLGRWSRPIRIVAVTWIVALTPILVLPPNQVAGYGFAGCLAGISLYWLMWARTRFAGPPVMIDR
jgi:amino acid transporter